SPASSFATETTGNGPLGKKPYADVKSIRPGLSEGTSIAAAPTPASARARVARITTDGSFPACCGSTRTTAPRSRSCGAGSVLDAGAPRSMTGAVTAPEVPGTHAYEPTWIALSTGATIRPDADPRIQRDWSGYSSKRASEYPASFSAVRMSSEAA